MDKQLTRHKQQGIPTRQVVTLLLIGVSALFYVMIFDQALFWRLPSLQFYPWRQFAFNEISEGRIPFWNPYLGGGTPLIANYQSAIFYPPNWLYLLLPDVTAMNVLVVLHIFLAGSGIWHFTRKLEFSVFGRAVSMFSFVLGMYYIGHAGDYPLTAVVAWLPWLFWAVLRILEKPMISRMGPLGLIAGMQLLAGHAQITWYSFLMAGVFVLWYTIGQMRRTPLRTRIAASVLCAAGILLGVGIASGQLLLTFEFLLQSHRTGGVDYKTLSEVSYAPWRIINLISPELFGNPVNGTYLDQSNSRYFEDTVYIGFLPLISVIFAVTGWFERRKFLQHHKIYQSVPFWLFITIAGYILALGRYTPLYRFLYDYVPTFDAFREPVQWLVLPAFALSILAGTGVHNWNNSPPLRFTARLAVVGSGGMIAPLIPILLFQSISSDALQNLLYALLLLCVLILGSALITLYHPDFHPRFSLRRWQWLVLVFIVFDLVFIARGLNPTVPRTYYERDYSITRPQGRLYWFEDYAREVRDKTYFASNDYRKATENWTAIRTSLLPNQSMTDRTTIFNNFDPLQSALHRQYIELIELRTSSTARLLRAAGIGQIRGEWQPDNWVETENGYISPDVPPTVWMVPEATFVENSEAVAGWLLSPSWEPAEQVILIDRDSALPDNEYPSFTTTPEIRTLEDTPGKVRYRVTSDGAGYLVVASTWYPGWEVTIDGEDAELYRANLAFQAVFIPPGGGDVEFTYTPGIAGAGMMFSLISLFFTLLLIAAGLLREGNGQGA